MDCDNAVDGNFDGDMRAVPGINAKDFTKFLADLIAGYDFACICAAAYVWPSVSPVNGHVHSS